MGTMRLTCDICGGEGVGTFRTASAAWDARATIAHRDPRTCEEEIRYRKRREQQDEERGAGSPYVSV